MNLLPNETRLHSSRMRTAHALTVSPSMLYGGVYLVPGGCLLPGVSAPGGVYLVPGGCTWSRGVSTPGGCTRSWGRVCSRRVWSPGGCLLLGWVSAHRGVYLVRYSPLPVDWQMPVNLLPCPKLRLRAVIRDISLIKKPMTGNTVIKWILFRCSRFWNITSAVQASANPWIGSLAWSVSRIW